MFRIISAFVVLASLISCKNSKPAADSQSPLPTASIPVQLTLVQQGMRPTVGACGTMDIQLFDAQGLFIPTVAKVTAKLTSSAASTTFYSDSACSTAITSVDIVADSSHTMFYFKDSVAGSPTVTATDAASPGLSPAAQVVVIAVPAKLNIMSSSSPSLTVATCNGFNIEVEDSLGVGVILAAPVDIKLQTSASTGVFYSDDQCATPISTVHYTSTDYSSGVVYYKDSSIGTATITISENPSQGWPTASLPVSIIAAQ